MTDNVANELRTAGVSRGDTWTAVVRKNDDTNHWWGHVLWCGEGHVEVGFKNQSDAIQWTLKTLLGCLAGTEE